MSYSAAIIDLSCFSGFDLGQLFMAESREWGPKSK